jgi:hypothetical protein
MLKYLELILIINEERTLQEFGYNSSELSKGSKKLVYRICIGCGKEQVMPYERYNRGSGLCRSCASSRFALSDETLSKMSAANSGENNSMYGKRGCESPAYGIHHTEETKHKLSINQSGTNNSYYGKHHSEKTKRKISAHSQGVSMGDWNGYSNYGYALTFNIELKTLVRSSTLDCDFLTGEHKDICNNGRELSVHHIDYDKHNSNIENLIPLSCSNHAKTNINRPFWIKLFTNMQHTKYLLERVNINENN